MTKKERDNRANQLNPNNKAYYKSRQGNQKKAKDKKPQTKTIVHNYNTVREIHHYHKPTSLFDLIFG